MSLQPDSRANVTTPSGRRSRRRLGLVSVSFLLLGVTLATTTAFVSPDRSESLPAAPSTTTARTAPTTTTIITSSSTSTTTTTTVPAPSTTTTVPPPPLRTPSREAPLSTLVVGDSTSFTVGHALIRQNVGAVLAPDVLFETSSGLARPDFFDWPLYLGMLAESNPPEILVVSLGANDGQALVSPDGAVHQVHTEGWRQEYLRRAEYLTETVTAAGTRLYWVGRPLARDPGFSAFLDVINGVFAEVAGRHDGAVYVDTWSLLLDGEGRYADALQDPDGRPVVVRQADGIHLTAAGGDIVVQVIIDAFERDWDRG